MYFLIKFSVVVRSAEIRCVAIGEVKPPPLPPLPREIFDEIISHVDSTESIEAWHRLNSWRRVSNVWNNIILARVDRILDSERQWLMQFNNGYQRDSEWKLMLASPYLAVRFLRELPRYHHDMLDGTNPLPTVPHGDTRSRLFNFEVRKLFVGGSPTATHAHVRIFTFGLSPAFFKALNSKLNEVFLRTFPEVATEPLVGKNEITWEELREYLQRTIFFVDDGPKLTRHNPNMAVHESYMTIERKQRQELLDDVVMSSKLPAEKKKLRVGFERPIKWDHRIDVYDSLDWDKIIGDMEERGKLVLEIQSDASPKSGRLKPTSPDYFQDEYKSEGLPEDWFEKPREK